MPRDIILYQYEVCPFCCKLKAFLDYHKVSPSCLIAVTVFIYSKPELCVSIISCL